MKKYFLIVLVLSFVFISACGWGKVPIVEQPKIEVPVAENFVTKVPILMYHYVRDVDKNLDPMGWRLSINPVDFEKQMKYLKDSGYTTLHLNDLVAGKVPEKAIVLTFDDGLTDFYTTALPILQKYGFTASNAVITGMVGTHEHMTVEQIKACISAGIEITSHTKSHFDMSSINDDDLLAQVLEARGFLVDNFGILPFGFVYPSGKYSDRAVKVLRESGYKVAVTINEGEVDLSKDNMLILPRIRVDNRIGFGEFKKNLESL